jgi:putative transposase
MATREPDVDSPEWRRARERAAHVRDIVGEGKVTKAAVTTLTARWGLSRATVWRRLRRFREDGSLRAFLDRPRGTQAGIPRLKQPVEDIIVDVARSWWKQTENATVAEILPTILAECAARKFAAPSRATVSRRLSRLRTDPSNFAGEVAIALRDKRRLVKSSYKIVEPLAVVQIDHTVADVFIVDPITRYCIGRPTLTIAIDVATRSVLGFCLSLEAPSVLLAALCLEHAVFPKNEWLTGIGLDVDWPEHGCMRALHCDNGKEFHSAAFRRGCDLNAVDIIYRPPATPRFGGHVERLIGTLMRRVRLLPGNSFSDLLKARPSQAEARAALTMSDLHGFLAEDIARYHTRKHRALGEPPRTAWTRAWGSKTPRVPPDRDRFRCEFLPLRRRVVGREGIELFNLKYSDEGLVTEVAAGIQRIVRFDPRDLSRIYLERKDEGPLPLRLRDCQLPALSLWEWNVIQRTKRRIPGARTSLSPSPVVSELSAPAMAAAPTALKANRRAARAAAWREVQAIAALPVPQVALASTLSSEDQSGTFAWEVLE